MDAILVDLGRLLLKALPTFFLVLLLHFYLKYRFYKPLDRALEQRRQATEGARQAAQASLETAERKAAEYEAALRAARATIYKEQEETRKQWRLEHAGAVEESRRKASEMVKQARVQLAAEVAEAKQSLAGEVERLASAITETILRGARV
ncbi:MAG: ATP synthase F0 subunit B [Bryobacteraceae bacterium]